VNAFLRKARGDDTEALGDVSELPATSGAGSSVFGSAVAEEDT
jgi:hypothetical protein